MSKTAADNQTSVSNSVPKIPKSGLEKSHSLPCDHSKLTPNLTRPDGNPERVETEESSDNNSVSETGPLKRKASVGDEEEQVKVNTQGITGHQTTVQEVKAGGRSVDSTSSPVRRAEFFVKNWEFVQTLGEGAYGEVKLAYNVKTGEAVAVKIVDTTERGTVWDDVRKEVCIHRMIAHKNIIKFYGVRREGDIQYLFLEYASGGELFDRIEPDVGMPQAEAQKFFHQLIDGLEYLHSKGVAHRDIKPENLLLDEHDDLKIADFGLATIFRYQGKCRYLERLCGSAPYLAPEVVSNKPYRAEPADLWSCGIVLVAMLGGELPWDAATLSCVEYANWRECHIENKPWSKIDNLALCLLRRLLVDKPEKRYTINEVRKNQWFNKDFSKDGAHQLSAGPKRLRGSGSESKHSPRPMSSSQPVMSCISSNLEPLKPCGDATAKVPVKTSTSSIPISFSQPVQADNMLLSSQLNGTQSSQTPMQKLVRRMTRFFCKHSRCEVMKELDRVFSLLGYTWKHCTLLELTVQTTDRRKSPLTFKATILEMHENLLVDFRLSKGDGLEFKHQFTRIREHMKPIICKVPPTWPKLPNI